MNVREKLSRGLLLFDGAMGTYFAEQEDREAAACELANLNAPDAILAIHKAYIRAGCDAIKTNTFAASPEGLDLPLPRALEIIRAGWNIAVQAAEGTDVSIFADVGPIPPGENGESAEAYYPILDQFLDLGAENFLFETFGSAEFLPELSAYLKARNPGVFILCSFAVMPDGYSRQGVSCERLFSAMEADPCVDAYGLNCVSGPNHMRRLLASIPKGSKPRSAMPNAGYPTVISGRSYFGSSSGYFAQQLRGLRQDGMEILGGCCGTTPEFLARAKAALDLALRIEVPAPVTQKTEQQLLPNHFWDKLERGEKVVAVELDPPINSDIRSFLAGAEALQSAGADAITLADCPVSRARADSSMLAAKLHRELGIETIPHLTCRDRNINATKALLLGLNIEGVNNVLVVTGDPVPSSERSQIKSVYSFNAPKLASFIRDLTPDLAGGPFRVYCALNVNAPNFEAHLNYAKKKLEAGASGFLTQPVHSAEALKNIRLAHQELGGKILGGLMPIVSYRNAVYMTGEIAGIRVPEELAERYRDLSREEAEDLSVEITLDFARRMSGFVDGYYLITPFMRTGLIGRIAGRIKSELL